MKEVEIERIEKTEKKCCEDPHEEPRHEENQQGLRKEMEGVHMKIETKLMNIQQKLKAPKGNHNDFGNYNYRSCEDILETLKPILAEEKCIILLSDEIVAVNDRVYVKATCTLKDTESEEQIFVTAYAREELSRPKMAEPQCTGSSSSYSRKYCLAGLLGLSGEKDADSMDNRNAYASTDKMIHVIQEQIKRGGYTEQAFCSLYGIKSLNDMTVQQFANAQNNEQDIINRLRGGTR